MQCYAHDARDRTRSERYRGNLELTTNLIDLCACGHHWYRPLRRCVQKNKQLVLPFSASNIEKLEVAWGFVPQKHSVLKVYITQQIKNLVSSIRSLAVY